MPKFLIKGNYSAEGVKGLMKEGGSARRTAVEKAIAPVNGKIEAFYYALGETDVFVVVDLPNATSAAALSMAVNSTGLVNIRVVALLTAEEIDAASKITVRYTPPKA
ncbi:MAG: GYD domain-containing protein [Chitinophagales bacterium]